MTTSQTNLAGKQLNLKTITWGDMNWVDLAHQEQDETAYLAEHYHFHPLDLDDCLSRKQLPKLDEYKDYLFLIFHFPIYNKETKISTYGQLSAFVGANYLITLHKGELKTLVKMFRDCEINEDTRQQNFSYGPSYLLYNILDRAVDSYFPILDKIFSLVEGVENTVFDVNVEAAQEISILRRDIITQRRIIWPMRVMFSELGAKLKRFTTADMSAYFGDLMDHMNKICETLDECKEIIEVYKDTDFVLSTDRLNRIMRVLTIIATIVLPFMAISSLYGMNVHMPGGITSGSWVPFIVIMLVMALITGVMLYYFRRHRWI